MKIAYVVLHYMAGKDTIECVESVLNVANQSEHDTKIVIVDNCSTNDSLQEIREYFKTINNIEIIRNDENLGFAKGNNVGFKYAKYVYGADFIVMLNNDTVMMQMDFNEIFVSKFESEQYYVLGPDIVTKDGYHQNPGKKQNWTFRELKIDRAKKRIRILLSYFRFDKIISNIVENLKEIYRTETLEGDVKNTILHGACWIFSPLYIKLFDGLHDETFLYMEEDILKLYADAYGFLMMYSGDLKILHKEDVATNMVQHKKGERERKKYKRIIESSKIYSKLKKKLKDVEKISQSGRI